MFNNNRDIIKIQELKKTVDIDKNELGTMLASLYKYIDNKTIGKFFCSVDIYAKLSNTNGLQAKISLVSQWIRNIERNDPENYIAQFEYHYLNVLRDKLINKYMSFFK